MRTVLAVLILTFAISVFPTMAQAHCDTLDGPVIADARVALETRELTPVLKWIRPADEASMRSLFEKTLAVRSQSDAAREIADRHFFETLVRVHRAGEGAPFTGLKDGPADRPITLADKALQMESVDQLTKELLADLDQGLRQRFSAALAARKHANDSVAAGREYVARYVELMHYIEALHQAGAEDASNAHRD